MVGEDREQLSPAQPIEDSTQNKEPLDRVIDQSPVLQHNKRGYFSRLIDLITRKVPEKAMDVAGKAEEKIGSPTALNPFETKPPTQQPTTRSTNEPSKS